MVDVTQGIVVFSSEYCPFCIKAKALLKSKDVEYTELVVDRKPDLRAQMTELAGSRSVPQIWIHGQHVGGCDQLVALEQSSKLDELLSQ